MLKVLSLSTSCFFSMSFLNTKHLSSVIIFLSVMVLLFLLKPLNTSLLNTPASSIDIGIINPSSNDSNHTDIEKTDQKVNHSAAVSINAPIALEKSSSNIEQNISQASSSQIHKNVEYNPEARYLAYQKENKYMHQGGVRGRFESERKQRETIFRKKHEYAMQPQQHAMQRLAFLKRQQSLQIRQKQILKLREKQKLQQDLDKVNHAK